MKGASYPVISDRIDNPITIERTGDSLLIAIEFGSPCPIKTATSNCDEETNYQTRSCFLLS